MQELKFIIENAIHNHRTELSLSSGFTEDDVYSAIRQVMRDNPDIFWFSHQWHFSQEVAKLQLHYQIDSLHSRKIKKQIDDVVARDFKIDYVRTLPVMEQIMYVYKWVALYCDYNIHSAHNQTIFSVFVYRTSVCTGIAKAAQYLYSLLGLESKLVFGKMNNSAEDSRHCWLVVQIDGRWYHLDPTFAIPQIEGLLADAGVLPVGGADGLLYNYFCTDADTIKLSRTIEDEDSLPICNETIDYRQYQDLAVSPSRNGSRGGLGCLLSDSGSTSQVFLYHSKDIYSRYRSVAKVYTADPDHVLLRKELRLMRVCAGPHILCATDADFDEGTLYVEQATPLSELLASHYYKLTVGGLCDLLIDIATGLKELLDHGIVYRDIHLNNIYLCEDHITGKTLYKLGDLGSCQTDEPDCGGVGSEWYMAPETFKNDVFDERSAVYGVGMIAYYLLNDLFPPLWQEYGNGALNQRVNSDRLPLPSMLVDCRFPSQLTGFIMRSMKLKPDERFQTLADVIESLNKCRAYSTSEIIVDGSHFHTSKARPLDVSFCSTCGINPSINVSNGGGLSAIESAAIPVVEGSCSNATTIGDTGTTSVPMAIPVDSTIEHSIIEERHAETFSPQSQQQPIQIPNPSSKPAKKEEGVFARWWRKLFGPGKSPSQQIDKESIGQKVNSSVFAPSETKRGDYMMVQVFLYIDSEEEAVACKAAEVDPTAQRQNHIPLSVNLKIGDVVTVKLSMSGKDIVVEEPEQRMMWLGQYRDCQFGVYVSEAYKPSSMMGTVVLMVNNIPIGRMMFKTQIVNAPQKLFAKIESQTFQKIFISYSHRDEETVKYFAKAFQAQGVDYFFDRHYLKAGDVYPDKIKLKRSSCDL